MYYAMFYEVVEDYIERRAPFRDQHLALARAARERGELVMGGAFADPPDGALLIFKGDGPGVAGRFAKEDPYVTNGIVHTWRVREWTVVIGN